MCTGFIYEKVSMNSDTIIEAINEMLLPFMENTRYRYNFTSLARCHQSNRTVEYMESQSIKFIEFGGHPRGKVGGYPLSSPDLNRSN